MAKTSTERGRKYREKHRESEDFKRKTNERSKKYQQENKKQYNKMVAERMRRMRAKKKMEKAGAENVAKTVPLVVSPKIFMNRQTEGKALKKIENALPKNLDQRLLIIKKAAEMYGFKVKDDTGLSLIPKPRTPMEIAITEFYRRDDISRILPGRKDVINITEEDGTKKSVAKKFLTMTVEETHALFLKENPQYPVKRTKFFELRPRDVYRMTQRDQNVCACPICENMEFSFQAASLDITCKTFIENLLCKNITEICRAMDCENCPIKSNAYMVPYLPEKDFFQVKKWTKGVLEIENIPYQTFKDNFERDLPKYLRHRNIKQVQDSALKKDKENLKEGEILIQTDFAENYTIRYHSEVMEKHWTSVPGVVILTAVIYYKESGVLKHKSYAVASDVSTNTTLEMVYLLEGILIDLRNSGIYFGKHVYLWTDGATKHFKNRFAMCFLTKFEDMYGSPIVWNFNESYHGKGPMDGIGAVVKHSVFMTCLREQVVVQNAKDFCEVAQRKCPSVTVIFRSAEALEEKCQEYIRIWQGAKDCSGILQARCVRPIGPYQVKLYKTSSDTQPLFPTRNLAPSYEDSIDNGPAINDDPPSAADVLPTESGDHAPTDVPDNDHDSNPSMNDLRPGSFVMIKFEYLSTRKFYVACVAHHFDEDHLNVKYLRRQNFKGSAFYYPEKEDWETIPVSSVSCKLPDPEVSKRSGNVVFFKDFTFPKETC